MTHDTVANLEASDAISNFDYLAGEIAAEDEGIFDPGGECCEMMDNARISTS
jgi:hypothetical protein